MGVSLSSSAPSPNLFDPVWDVSCEKATTFWWGEAQRAYVDRVERGRARVVPWIFCYPYGRRIKHPENAFNIAAAAIGRPDLNIHDLRRFAASRMAEPGIPETDAMELLGMETRSIFTRYDISSGARKVRAVERLAGALDAEPQRKVERIR